MLELVISGPDYGPVRPVRLPLLIVLAVICVVITEACAPSNNESDCHIPQPAVGDSGSATLQAHPARHVLTARFGGRHWLARSQLNEVQPLAHATVIPSRPRGRRPKTSRRGMPPRLRIETSPPIVLNLVEIGCG